jgi:hypothetical protein
MLPELQKYGKLGIDYATSAMEYIMELLGKMWKKSDVIGKLMLLTTFILPVMLVIVYYIYLFLYNVFLMFGLNDVFSIIFAVLVVIIDFILILGFFLRNYDLK